MYENSPHGVLSNEFINEMITRKQITTQNLRQDLYSQVQPASIDLTFGNIVYKIHHSFLPLGCSVTDFLWEKVEYSKYALEDNTKLFAGTTYLIPLREHLCLTNRVRGKANPKSSIGRLDILVRLVTDYGEKFDEVKESYIGPLWAEVTPLSFDIRIKPGMSMNQLRFIFGEPNMHTDTLSIHTLDPDQVIGFEARKDPQGDLSLMKTFSNDWRRFWKPITGDKDWVIIKPNHFYIFTSKEAVRVEADKSAEVTAYDPGYGEFRSHYAGFFDPGFGTAEPVPAVLEIRPHNVSYCIQDGQPLFSVEYTDLIKPASIVYGEEIGSHYHKQVTGYKSQSILSKYFQREDNL